MKNKTITFRTTKEFYDHLIMESHRLSLEREKNLKVSDIIRESLERNYPIKKASNISKEVKKWKKMD